MCCSHADAQALAQLVAGASGLSRYATVTVKAVVKAYRPQRTQPMRCIESAGTLCLQGHRAAMQLLTAVCLQQPLQPAATATAADVVMHLPADLVLTCTAVGTRRRQQRGRRLCAHTRHSKTSRQTSTRYAATYIFWTAWAADACWQKRHLPSWPLF